MQIAKNPRGNVLDIRLEGVLDNETSFDLRGAIDDAVRDGWHRILVDLSQVTYISSAGIGALVDAKKRLDKIKGTFGVYGPTESVETVLRQTRVLDMLLCEPDVETASRTTGTMTWGMKARLASEEGADYQVFSQDATRSLRCLAYGDPARFSSSRYSEGDPFRVTFPQSTFGIGLGALGDDFAGSRDRFGELLSVSGAVARSALTNGGLPDYLMGQADFTPSVQLLHGLRFEGEFADLIRFNAWDAEQPIPFSRLLDQSLKLMDCASAGVVLLGECAGLIGCQLRRSPCADPSGESERLAFPDVRRWLSFSPEHVHRRSLTLVVGGVTRSDGGGPLLEAAELLRPLDESASLLGHFHAAVFPYRPLKKRTLDLHALVAELFDSGTIVDVLHLLRDDRPGALSVESEFVSGGCWLAPVESTAAAAASS